MTPSYLRSTIIATYVNLYESIVVDSRGNARKVSPSQEQIEGFHNWLVRLIVETKVEGEFGEEIEARDAIGHDALRTQSIPPFKPLYPMIRRAISVLSHQELVDLFGETFANKVVPLMH